MSERNYLDSHPWLDFELDLRAVRPDLWIALGEIVQGSEMFGAMPLDPDSSREIISRSLAKGLHGLAALEGNLLELSEVEMILDPASPDPVYADDRKEEILGIKGVIRYIHKGIEGAENFCRNNKDEPDEDVECIWDLSSEDIAGFNKSLTAVGHSGVNIDAAGLKNDAASSNSNAAGSKNDPASSNSKAAGSVYRITDAVDMGYRGVPPGDCEYLLGRLCAGLSEIRRGFPSGNTAVSGILRGVMAHAYIAWIMPFAKGNCLSARIAEYQLMRSGGIPGPVVMLLEWYYNRTSREYWKLLGRSGQRTGDLVPFIEYVLTGLHEAVSDLTREMTGSQGAVIWGSHLRKAVSGQGTRITDRQLILIEDISAVDCPVKISRLLGVSARVSNAYAGCSERTLARDVNILIELGLLERVKRSLRPRRERLIDHEAPFKR